MEGHAKRQLDALLALDQPQDDFQNLEWGSRDRAGDNALEPGIGRLSISENLPQDASAGSGVISREGESSHNFVSPRGSVSHWRGSSNAMSDLVLIPDLPSMPRQVSSLYARASSLLLTALDVEGVLFLDAPRGNSRSNSRRSSCVSLGAMDGVNGIAGPRNRPFTPSLVDEWTEKACNILSSALSEHGSSDIRSSSSITNGLLQGLFEFHSDGGIFNSVQAGTLDTASQELADGLARSFPEASSVLFLPVWDWDKARWASGVIAWTHRTDFSEDDLRYVQHFCTTVVSKLIQIDRDSTAKAKENLLSSLSHELRSPLHGMLANSELLQATSLGNDQQEMIKMIKTCGNTLLDTMNHLLVFAKINNLSNVNNLSTDSAAQIESLTTDFDLDSLLEDVTESLYAGSRSAHEFFDPTCRVQSPWGTSGTDSGASEIDDASIAIRIKKRNSWRIQSISGAWRRIIMSVVGNALKFTRRGAIEIALDASDNQKHVHLQVTDTGCGISKEYLQNKLFSSFSQEHILTEGVGLGLSISQKLVASLGGHIDIKSELGQGTQVKVQIPVKFVEQEYSTANGGLSRPKKICLIGFDSSPNGNGDQHSTETRRINAIRSTITSALHSQAEFDLSSTDSLSSRVGDIAVVERSALQAFAGSKPIKTAFPSILVLGGHNAPTTQDLPFEPHVNVISIPQPLGPRKIMQALKRLDQMQTATTYRGRAMHPVLSPMRANSLSAVFEAHKGVNSPPVARDSVTEYTAPVSEPVEKPLHVLIVDDNDINVKVLANFMDKIGCTYDTASNGLTAFEKYKKSKPCFDFVLMDLSMPVMDGVTATSKIREYEDANSRPQSIIMAVTGVASSEMQQKAFDAGIDEYLVKPLSLKDLKRIMGVS
ncbi:hybrid sensor histidine kinase/response regulator [Aspergillus stella-maris]|uniref:hybrid sensor histidine kinase/response regulator n=1 Tax=Aspergillus stella-maris TaxID=1810926 RepID=UPI003CCCBCCA